MKQQMRVREQLQENLNIYMKGAKSNKHITLDVLQKCVSGQTEYEVFAREVLALEEEGILIGVKSQKTNGKKIALYNKYTVIKEKFMEGLVEQIRAFQLQAHPMIKLAYYLKAEEAVWKKDYKMLCHVNDYLKRVGMPTEEATMPERSYEMTGDEKWIEAHGGRTLLERTGLWEQMKISMNADPAMFTIHKKELCERGTNEKPHKHLIVENKSIYYLIQSILKETSFTSLTYGCGWKITASMNGLLKQMDLEEENNEFYYFGDLDYEGIAIYAYLGEKVKPALSFYNSLLELSPSKGKTNQRKNEEALELFIKHFSKEQESKIREVLQSGLYYPQEALTKEICLKCMHQYE